MAERTAIATTDAPGAIGPYSQAVAVGDLVFISGQLPIDMATGELCPGAIGEQTTHSLRNAAAIAKAAGTELSKAVKTTIFLADMKDFAEVNAAYAAFFPENPPARSCVAVAGLPKNARIEIEVVCAR
jgi:2-iminobutanoate/2-iminopropanoate deaminase